ncbi:DUF2382 domain-containing protein [Microbacterium sp. NPDC080220]|uniref:DUF2382 domain-containing protein n=1 Tax=Microbacterium TaxID=33882 RepID=UPI003449152F
MVLHQEQLTITRRAVPVEAVTVRVSRAQREHRIDETPRHEQVDIVEHDISRGDQQNPESFDPEPASSDVGQGDRGRLRR